MSILYYNKIKVGGSMSHIICFRVSSTVLQSLKQHSDQMGVSVSQLLRLILKSYLGGVNRYDVSTDRNNKL